MPAYYARALYDYAPAAGEDELALVKGELVEVLSTEDDDWWRGRARGLEGDFPATYVEVVDGPDEEIAEDGGLSLDGGGSYAEPATPEEELMPAAPPPEDAEPAPPPLEDLGDLPPDWESAEDDAGETYYWNVKTNETSWTKPAADPPKPRAAPPPPKRPEGTPPKKAPHAGRSLKPTTPEKAPERPEEDQPRGGLRGMRQGSNEIPNFRGSDLGRVPLVSADFWTCDDLLGRSRSVDAFVGTSARGTRTLKRR